MVPVLPMFFSTWETYHTHTLYLGYFNGPTEGLIIATSMMVVSGIYGPEIWKSPLLDIPYVRDVNILSRLITHQTSIRDVWIPIILGTFFVAHLPFCILNVWKARSARNEPMLATFLQWTPMLLFLTGLIGWLGSPYTTLLKSPQEHSLVLFSLTMSLVFGRMTTKIILAHLTRQPFPYFTVMLVPLLGGAVLVNLPALGLSPIFDHTIELWYLRNYFLFAAVVYGRWAVLVISSICSYLGINCLTIPVKGREGRKIAPGQLKFEKDVSNGVADKKAQ